MIQWIVFRTKTVNELKEVSQIAYLWTLAEHANARDYWPQMRFFGYASFWDRSGRILHFDHRSAAVRSGNRWIA